GVLYALRKRGHPALAVGELELMAAHGAADFAGKMLEQLPGKGDMVGGGVCRWRALDLFAPESLAQQPAGIGCHFPPQGPNMARIGELEIADVRPLQGLADRLEKGSGVLFDQGFEKRQAE